MIVTNKLNLTRKGRSFTIVKGLEEVGVGKLAKKFTYDWSDSRKGFSREEMTQQIQLRLEVPRIVALTLLDKLDNSNVEEEEPVRRVDPGAPALGRPGLPVRPLAAVR